MCGIVGTAGSVAFKEEKAFKTMLEVDTIRGPHSTGVAFVNSKYEVDVAKQLGTPWDLYCSNQFKSLMGQKSFVLLGHNRWATQGRINRSNAHPFEFDSVVGVHNGTLKNKFSLEGGNTFDVDSEALYNHIDIHGIESAAEKARGAFALVWFDKDNQTLNFLRNDERELFYCFSEDGKTLFWSSEPWMMLVALDKENINHNKIRMFEEEIHYSIAIPTNGSALGPFSKKKLKLHVPQAYTSFNIRSLGHYQRPTTQNNHKTQSIPIESVDFYVLKEGKTEYGNTYVEGKTLSGKHTRAYCGHLTDLFDELIESKEQRTLFTGIVKLHNQKEGDYFILDNRTIVKAELEEDEGDYLYPIGNILVPEKDFIDKTKQGCCFCSSPVSTEDADELVWVGDDFFCPNCKDLDEAKDFIA